MEMKGSSQKVKKRGFAFFVTFFTFLLLSGNLLAETVGIIMSGNIHYYNEIHRAFLSRLKKEGYSDRVEIVLQKPYPDYISLSNAARKLNALDVDLIITYGAGSTMAVIDTKTKTPLIYSCLSDTFAQRVRGRNITGISYRLFPSSLLRYIKEIVTIKSIGIIYSSNDPDSVLQMEDIRKASEHYGMRTELINLNNVRDVKKILSGRGIDAILITQAPVTEAAFTQIIEFSRSQRIPSASLLPGNSGHYPTIALYAKEKEIGEKIAEMTIKILDGSNPERVKVSCCNEVELVFNLREVKEMGYKIPMDLVATATKLIQ